MTERQMLSLFRFLLISEYMIRELETFTVSEVEENRKHFV